MNQAWLVLREEWRYWLRSRLAMGALGLTVVALAASLAFTWAYGELEAARRLQLQTQAEEAFQSQPARHPHRMVHYGHYAFRAPVPLAALDPGIDPFAGMVIFLEGHRQNSAMFAEVTQLASLARFGSLSPAFVLQVIAPLLLVILGFNGIARERERGTLLQLQASGVKASRFVTGKLAALLSVAALLLLPFVGAGLTLLNRGGESSGVVLALAVGYAAYLATWCVITTACSVLLRRSTAVLAVLLVTWVVAVIVAPRLAGTAARELAPVPGQIASELEMLTNAALTDGHSATDPASSALTANLLATYGVDDVTKLPMNIRGVLSSEAEAASTTTMNRAAELRFAAELRQAELLDNMAWLSPLLALRRTSMTLAGTDLPHQHRFLREAEAVRFEFVQALNDLHAEALDYSADIRRSSDVEAEQRTRIDASNWRLLPTYRFQVAQGTLRMHAALQPLALQAAWLVVALLLLGWAARRARQ